MARYTPELIADIRHAYEEADQPMRAMAADYRIPLRTLCRMVVREGWNRRADRPARNIPGPMRILREAEAVAAAHTGRADAGTAFEATAESISAAGRIERMVDQELADVERSRARLGKHPRPPEDAERVARTLAALVRALQAVAPLRPPKLVDPDDEIPQDIDEFRLALAGRMHAFLDAWTREKAEAEAAAETRLDPDVTIQ